MDHTTEFTELHAWIADHAAALVNRSAAARSEVILRECETVRTALDALARSVEGAATPELEAAQVGGFVDRLTERLGLDALRAQLEEQQAANQRLSELERAGRAELEEARRELAEERARASAACADAAEIREAFDSSLDDLSREHELFIGEQARTIASLPLDQLLSVFEGFEKAATIAEVVVTLVDGIGREFPRVALFSMRGGSLRCRQQAGFDFQNEDSNVVIPLLGDSLLTRAVTTGRLESFFADAHCELDAVLPFGGTPECALAIPVVVQGAVTAVIYADDSNGVDFQEGSPKARLKFAELLYQHAVLVLLTVSARRTPQNAVEQKVSTPDQPLEPASVEEVRRALRDFAFKLTDELEYDYVANAEIGRNRLECQRRLKAGLEESRRLYAERIRRNPIVPKVTSLLDDHLIAVARARDQTSFGRALHTLVAAS